MENTKATEKLIKRQNVNDHLANERTMLAWVRTGIGVIAFGFAVVKFSLFVRQISAALGKNLSKPHGYSAEIGMALVALGTLSIVFAYFQYRHTERQLDAEEYQHSSWLIQLLVALISLIGIALLIYLVITT